jgi:DNA-binding protein Fis
LSKFPGHSGQEVFVGGQSGYPAASFLWKAVLAEAERNAIEAALQHTGNNKAKADGLQGIHRTGLYPRMHKYKFA